MLDNKPAPIHHIVITRQLFIIALYIFLSPVTGFGQFTIAGRIINQADTRPIADCSVFLSNATNGTKTNYDGNFELIAVKPGKYTLVVSFVGYDPYSQQVAVTDSNITLPDITLFPKIIALAEVLIKPDIYRERNLSWFKDEFLGTSALARQCSIINPEIINLSYDGPKGLLTASSPDFLIIENPALGYRVKYLLNNFLLNNKVENARQIHYDGSVLFENIKGTPAQERRWQKRREELYANSPIHFLRALLNNQLASEGFRATQIALYQNPERPGDSLINTMIKKYEKIKGIKAGWRDSLSYWNAKLKLPKTLQKQEHYLLAQKDLVYPTDMRGLMALSCSNDNIQVDYNKNARFSANGTLNSESTILSFKEPYAFFDNNGGIANPGGIAFSGAWGRNRVAELLPVDFEPASTNPNPVDAGSVTANTGPLNNLLLKAAAASNSLNTKAGIENLYVQFDKPYYALNDTLWFKAYLLNATYLMPSVKSGFIYVDMMNDSSKAIKRYKFPVGDGLTWGSIGLADKKFTPGTYTLRAYTNWMRNFGEDCFFTKQFYVSSAGESSLLINSDIKIKSANNTDTAKVKLLFSDMDKTAYAVKPLQLQVMAGNKSLYRQKIETGVDGGVDVKFAIPVRVADISIVATSGLKDKKAVIPVILNRPENVDIQFLPEGGNLIAGMSAHIGLKVIGEDGRGMDVQGTIINHEQKQVAEFHTIHNGMGSFNLPVIASESYTAKIVLPGGVIKSVALPVVKTSGIKLSIKNEVESDSLQITIAASADIIADGNNYFLIGSARGIVCYAVVVGFYGSNQLIKKIGKSMFPTGIAHFTLMTAKGVPLNERVVFINRDENLDITLNTNKPDYATRDSISIKIKVTDTYGKPANGSFSMAVTDDTQVKADSLNGENILWRFLLTADIKGYVEQPGYYFSSKKPAVWQALDDLLLTQGWVSYDLNQPIKFEPETQLTVSGRIVNVFNKPVKGSDVLLFSKSPAILKNTLTNNEGRFRFANFPRVDTPLFILQAVNKNAKNFNVLVSIDEIMPPKFTENKRPVMPPWYLNSDTTLLKYAKTNKIAREQQYFPDGGHILKEVTITAKKFVKDSQNLNGPGNADQVLDEKELEKQEKKTLLEVLLAKVKGFKQAYYKGEEYYVINGLWARFIIDGYDFYTVLAGEDLKYFLTTHNAEDIKGIEVNASAKNTTNYCRRFCPLCVPGSVAFIEITTRSGHGPFISNTPGVFLYKPLPISWPKQFYKPKYTTKDTARPLPDLRSTIDWEPNILTNNNGEATVWFYSADKPSTYTIIVEGTDLNGTLGHVEKKITVKN